MFLDPGVCWLCLAVNQNYAYLEIVKNEINSASCNNDGDNIYINHIDEYLAKFLHQGYSTEVTEELVQRLELKQNYLLTPLWVSKPILIKEVTDDSEIIVNEIPIHWYVLPTPVYGILEDIRDSVPLIRLSYLLKLVLEGYLLESQNIWMIDVNRNNLRKKNELHTLPYNYITSMYLLPLISNLDNDKVFVDIPVQWNVSYGERIIFALLCHSNISEELLHFLQGNVTEWINCFPFLDDSYLFINPNMGDLYSITIDDDNQEFSVSKTLTFNLFNHKKNVQNNKFFLTLLCVHRYVECGLWIYHQLLQSERKENKQLAETQLPLIDKDQMRWLALDCETEPITIETIIDLIQPVIEKGQFILNQTYQSFVENGK